MSETNKELQDFVCKVSDLIWGGELAWSSERGLDKLFKELKSRLQAQATAASGDVEKLKREVEDAINTYVDGDEVGSVSRQVIDHLRRSGLLSILSADDFAKFQDALEKTPEPNDALVELLSSAGKADCTNWACHNCKTFMPKMTKSAPGCLKCFQTHVAANDYEIAEYERNMLSGSKKVDLESLKHSIINELAKKYNNTIDASTAGVVSDALDIVSQRELLGEQKL